MFRWFAFLITYPLAAGLSGCSSMNSTEATANRACCQPLAANAFSAEKSIYDREATWETDAGEFKPLAALAGKPQVVELIHATCQVTCPITLQSMKQLEASLPKEARSQVGFVLVTLDPLADSPATLRSFRRSQQLSSRWTLLRGTSSATQLLAHSLGVAFVRDNYRLAHSTQITVLDAHGKIVFRQIDLHVGNDELAQAVAATIPPQTLIAH